MVGLQIDKAALNDLPSKPDDHRLALEITKRWNRKVKFFHNNWYVYQDGFWQSKRSEEIKRGVRHFLVQWPHRGFQITSARINSVVEMARWEMFVDDEKIDTGRQYINLQNGLFNLNTYSLEAHNPEHYFTSQLDFTYDPDADCPNFRRFLHSSLVQPGSEKTDHDMVNLVIEALAYSMTADTSQKAAFWLVGEPDSGKSTLISFLVSFMGQMHATLDLNQLGSNRFLLSSIVGKRCVSCTEANTNLVLPDGIFKALVGGEDQIYVDVKNKEGISFKPTAKLWWAMNDAPRVTDRSGAVYNRLRVIRFNRSIPKEKRILRLADILAGEKSGIFNWLITGFKRLKHTGSFTIPAQSAAFMDDYILKNDTEKTFVLQCCSTGKDFTCTGGELYKAYGEWCDDNGFRKKNSNQAADEWRRLGFYRTGLNGKSIWHGLKLNQISLENI